MKTMRFDLVFSYWIYLWYIFYELKFIKYSPKFAVYLGLIDNIVMLFLMVIFGTRKLSILYFIIINALIKGVPLYYLRNQNIRISDIYFTFFLFLLFVFWLHINRQSLVGNITQIHDSLLYGKNDTPIMRILSDFFSKYSYT
jgi:signal transduction histidine kinase